MAAATTANSGSKFNGPPTMIGNRPLVSFPRPAPKTFSSIDEESEFKLGRLAGIHRIFHSERLETGANTAISMRDLKKKDALWIKPAGMANAIVRKSDLICVDFDGNILKPSGREGAGGYDEECAYLHIGIYKARPDLQAVVQANTTWGSSFSMLGKNIDMILQDSCSYYKKIHLFPLEEGSITSDKFDEGNAAKRLQDGKALIMLQRGLLTVGQNLEASLAWFIRLNNICFCQLMADAAARGRGEETVKVDQEALEYTFNTVGNDQHAWVQTQPYFEVIEEDPESDHLL